jgi:hypothetical protein
MSRAKQDTIMDIISEFIFCEKMDRYGRPSQNTMSLVQEFQLIIILCNYFSQSSPETTRNTIFLSLFGGSISPSRISVLTKLVSTSISALISPVLCASGTLMVY